MEQVSPDTGTTSNTYDSAGNILTSTNARNKTATYAYDALYQPFGPTAGWTWGNGTLAVREYDQDGNISDIDSHEGRRHDNVAHNGLGQRVRKTHGGVSTYFVYDEAGHLVGEYDGAGNLIQETVWFGDIPVGVLKASGSGVTAFYIHTDHLNTPRRISRSADNATVWTWESDPFGTTAANQDADGDGQQIVYGLRFPGQYHDAETSLHYNYYRDYDPATGRYVQSDPIGLKPLRFAAVRNLYGYVEGDPIGNVDPFGLETAQITMRHPLPPPALLGSWGVGGCLGTFCIDWDSSDADSMVSVPFPPEIGGGITFCAKPEPTCDAPADQGGKAINFGLGKRAGVSVGFDGKLCVNLGLGLGSPISFSGDVGPLK